MALRRLCGCFAAKKVIDEPRTSCEEGKADAKKFEKVAEEDRPKQADELARHEKSEVAHAPLPGVPEAQDTSGLPQLKLENGDHHLTILEMLGKGVSGCRVNRCQSSQISEQTSLAGKVLPLGKATFPDMVEDFGREVEMMKSLPPHASIVSFHGAWSTERYRDGETELKAYVMLLELCDTSLESDIRKRRQQQQPYSEPELVHVLKQVAGGLAHLHRHRVLHRDLKSANIWLCKREGSDPEDLATMVAKVGDFDAAKAGSRAQTPVQTPHFMAPEVASKPGEDYGPAADIWAFGCVVFEMLELALPYGDDLTLPQLEDALMAGAGPQLSDRATAKLRSKCLVGLMDRCLHKEAAQRPTAEEVLSFLEAPAEPADETAPA